MPIRPPVPPGVNPSVPVFFDCFSDAASVAAFFASSRASSFFLSCALYAAIISSSLLSVPLLLSRESKLLTALPKLARINVFCSDNLTSTESKDLLIDENWEIRASKITVLVTLLASPVKDSRSSLYVDILLPVDLLTNFVSVSAICGETPSRIFSLISSTWRDISGP